MELKDYMKTFDVTAAAIAAETGVTVQAISQYCRKVRKPRPDIALKLVAATKGQVSLTDLYAGPSQLQE